MKKIGIGLIILAVLLIASGLGMGYLDKIDNKVENNDEKVENEVEVANYESVSFHVEKAGTLLSIYTKNYIDFEGLKDSVLASEVTKTKDKGIIKEVSLSSGFEDNYSADYDIEGEDVKSAVYVVEGMNNEARPLTVGINYYNNMLAVELLKAESVEFEYKKSVLVNGVQDDFKVMFRNFDKNNLTWGVGVVNINFEFIVTEESNISVSWVDDHFQINSDKAIDKLVVNATDHYTLDVIASGESQDIKNSYRVTLDGDNMIVE